MALSWANEIHSDAAGAPAPALNFTAMLDEAQAAVRARSLSNDEEVAATPGQCRTGSKAQAPD